jgi:EAL domain-containing protein (putative c-di-GMP-specific phosphodiesterase class I)
VIIGLAHLLNLVVIAEGVESAAQADFLQRENCEPLRCEQLQGYFFSRLLNAAAMTTWLMKRARLAPPAGTQPKLS